MVVVSKTTSALSPYILILKGGKIYNPISNKFERKDLKVQNGKIVAKAENIRPASTDTVSELDGNHFVSPGWIDLHTHYFGCWGNGMDPIQHGLYKGVALQVDAGSAGMSTFEDFDQLVLNKTDGMLLAMLNISPAGLAQQTGENMFLTNHSAQKTADVAKAFSDKIKMIKIRIGPTQNTSRTGIEALKMAKEAARLAGGLPLMVHIENGSPLKQIFDMLEAGDIVTHAFRKNDHCNILDKNNRLKPYVVSALKRGVRLDIGHGYGGFDRDNVKVGMEAIAAQELLSNENYRPLTTSTDLHCFSVEKMAKSLPEVMAKMLSVGMSLEDTVASVTKHPANALRLPDSVWQMNVGDEANLTVWGQKALEPETHEFTDANKNIWYGTEMLEPKLVYVNKQLFDIAVDNSPIEIL